MKWRFLVIVIMLFGSLSLINALLVEQTIIEDQSATRLLDGRYTISVSGTLVVTNPSQVTPIYEYRHNLELPDNVFGGFQVTSTSPMSLSQRGFFGFNLPPSNSTFNSSISIDYSFSGIMTGEEFDLLEDGNISFLEAFSNPTYIVRPSINVDKPISEHEDQTIFNSTSGEYETIPRINNRSIRVVGTSIVNPTEFFLQVYEFEILRTRTTDTFLENAVLIGEEQDFQVEPFGVRRFDYYDRNSTDNSIYWIRSHVSAAWSWDANISYNLRIQQPPATGGGGGGGAGVTPPITPPDEDEITEQPSINDLVITKSVDKFFVSQGEELTVTIRVLNLRNTPITNISFKDLIPEGYSLVRINNANVNGRELNFNIDFIDAFSEVELEYVLVREHSTRSFTFLPPVQFDGLAITEGVLILEEVIGNTNLFMQKEITWQDSEYSRVRITIRNVGNSRIADVKLLDDINPRYRMREISKPFHEETRGLWYIDSLAPGATWSVEYIVENHNGISQLPILLNVDDSNVYGTIISNSHVESIILHQSVSLFERVGLIIAILLVLFYILF